MDGTSYPPPTPAVPPPGAPQPQYAPPAQGYPPAQPPKKKTGLVIAIVVIVLLLCCCTLTVGGYFAYKAASEAADEAVNDISTDLADPLGLEEGTDEDTGPALDTGWEDFAPVAYDTSVWLGLSGPHQEVLDEVMSTMFPDFVLQDAVVKPSTEYTTDLVCARAYMADDPDAQIAFYLEVENDEAFSSGWSNDPATQEYDYLDWGTAGNGREYFWDNTQLVPLFYGGDYSTLDLISQVGSDFPDSVVFIVESDGSSGTVEFTRWDAYPDYSSGYTAYYSYDGSDWVLDSTETW